MEEKPIVIPLSNPLTVTYFETEIIEWPCIEQKDKVILIWNRKNAFKESISSFRELLLPIQIRIFLVTTFY